MYFDFLGDKVSGSANKSVNASEVKNPILSKQSLKNVTKVQAKTRKAKLQKVNDTQACDLLLQAIYKDPVVARNLDSGSLADTLNRVQDIIFKTLGKKVSIHSAYLKSEQNGHLLRDLIILLAKGIIIPHNNNAHRSALKGRAFVHKAKIKAFSQKQSDRIYFITAKETVSEGFERLGRFSGIYEARPAITRFCAESINALDSAMNIKSVYKVNSSNNKSLYSTLLDAYIKEHNFARISKEEVVEQVKAGLKRNKVRSSRDIKSFDEAWGKAESNVSLNSLEAYGTVLPYGIGENATNTNDVIPSLEEEEVIDEEDAIVGMTDEEIIDNLLDGVISRTDIIASGISDKRLRHLNSLLHKANI